MTTVEFAITAPIVFMFFFTSYEFSRMEMVRHTVDIAAYEGARRGIVAGATSADITQRVQQVLAPISIRDVNVSINPAVITRSTRQVTVEVQVPMASNGWVFPRFVGDLSLKGESTLAREGFTSPDAS
jgi:Flp pilus assembly protein TadG